MTESQWIRFQKVRHEYKTYIDELSSALPDLSAVLSQLVAVRSGPAYPIETPVVYNHALDDIGPDKQIKIILVADNPGRREQSAAERRYLVGPSGKLADGFFKQYPELGIEFRKHVLILNKCPIHTPRTGELRDLARLGGLNIEQAIKESQSAMARFIHQFHEIFADEAELWIIGYSELGKGKLFEPFTNALLNAYSENNTWGAPAARPSPTTGASPAGAPLHSKKPSLLKNSMYLYRHFSMNQFSADFKKQRQAGERAEETLHRIGLQYRAKIFGW
ncbi:hypothetical protein [Gracilinema caldarium]|uniref:hypothetical protein n=1 Tax=Gracilinema caldarium TaxID=215591 RepID=UPI0026F2F01F|nr:hypothetical protein [Gracilinema caldarium]